MEIRVDRDMEYVHMKDMRGAGFDLINQLALQLAGAPRLLRGAEGRVGELLHLLAAEGRARVRVRAACLARGRVLERHLDDPVHVRPRVRRSHPGLHRDGQIILPIIFDE
ncbi:MAG: hypothetical protein IPP94_19860 [Ignavibacteria bacterium]|nr:hypothetical protein [Ignavibacteria bacterium]